MSAEGRAAIMKSIKTISQHIDKTKKEMNVAAKPAVPKKKQEVGSHQVACKAPSQVPQ